jgi:hypothetical protein
MQLAHFGEFVDSNEKKFAHVWVWAPSMHACPAFAISVVEQTP